MASVDIQVARAFKPFLAPSRYKAAFGGRGSGKSHFFAGNLIRLSYAKRTRAVCIREVQNSIKDSVKQLLEDKIQAFGLGGHFETLNNEIRGPNDSLIIFRGMQHFNSESIKSLEGYDIAWVAEAQSISQRSLDLLRPTLRKDGSELWFDWNPESEKDPVDQFFRGENPPKSAVIRRITWRDNPWFPAELKKEMLQDRDADVEKAAHIWDGEYQVAPKGAYYAKLIAEAKLDGRLGKVPHDPHLDTHVAFDLGNGPNMVLWFTQWKGREIRLIDYLEGDDEATGVGWPWYIKRMREKPYTYAPIILPHDARARQRGTGKSDEVMLMEAGFKTTIVDRMDPGQRVKLVQIMLPQMWIDEEKCALGLSRLKAYRSNYDERMRVDRGPLHDENSHGADALGHLCQAYDAPQIKKKKSAPMHAEGAWMG